MARKSVLAILVGVAAFAVPSAFADKGGIPHQGSSGQGRPAEQTQQSPAQTHVQTKTTAKAKANGHAKSHGQAKVHTQGTAHAYGHSNASGRQQAKVHTQGAPATEIHAKAGKTTICHATGSATNPYVTITISNNAVPAHQRHQDGRDIIPAPAGGCPSGTIGGAQQTPATGQQEQSQQAQAPASTQQQTATAAPTTGSSTTGAAPSSSSGKHSSGSSPGEQQGILGTSASGTSPSASSSAAATATRAASSSALPFTGTDAIVVAILGLAAVLLGVTVRRAATTRD